MTEPRMAPGYPSWRSGGEAVVVPTAAVIRDVEGEVYLEEWGPAPGALLRLDSAGVKVEHLGAGVKYRLPQIEPRGSSGAADFTHSTSSLMHDGTLFVVATWDVHPTVNDRHSHRLSVVAWSTEEQAWLTEWANPLALNPPSGEFVQEHVLSPLFIEDGLVTLYVLRFAKANDQDQTLGTASYIRRQRSASGTWSDSQIAPSIQNREVRAEAIHQSADTQWLAMSSFFAVASGLEVPYGTALLKRPRGNPAAPWQIVTPPAAQRAQWPSEFPAVMADGSLCLGLRRDDDDLKLVRSTPSGQTVESLVHRHTGPELGVILPDSVLTPTPLVPYGAGVAFRARLNVGLESSSQPAETHWVPVIVYAAPGDVRMLLRGPNRGAVVARLQADATDPERLIWLESSVRSGSELGGWSHDMVPSFEDALVLPLPS